MSRSSPTSGSHTRSLLVSDHPQVQLPFTFVPLPEARAQRNQQLQWQHENQHHSERIVPSLRPHLRPLKADGHARLPSGAPTKPTNRHHRITNPPSSQSSLAFPSPSPSPNPYLTPLQTSISPDHPHRQPPNSPSPRHHGHPPSDHIPSYVDAARHPVFQIESSARSSSQAEVHHQPPYDKRDWQGYPYDRGCLHPSPSRPKRGHKTMPKVSSSKRHRSILPAPAPARRPSPPPYSSSFPTAGLCTLPLPSLPASQTHKDLYYEYSDSPSPSVPGSPTLSERLTFVPVIPNMTFLPHPDVFLGPLMAHNFDVVRFDSRSPEPWAGRRVDFEVESEFEPEVVDGIPPPSVVDMMGGEFEVVSADADDLWSASSASASPVTPPSQHRTLMRPSIALTSPTSSATQAFESAVRSPHFLPLTPTICGHPEDETTQYNNVTDTHERRMDSHCERLPVEIHELNSDGDQLGIEVVSVKKRKSRAKNHERRSPPRITSGVGWRLIRSSI